MLVVGCCRLHSLGVGSIGKLSSKTGAAALGRRLRRTVAQAPGFRLMLSAAAVTTFRQPMAIDPPEEPTRSSGSRNGRVNQEWSEPTGTSGSPIVDMGFDSGGLAALRHQLQTCALQAGLPEDLVVDVVLAVHELAANAVRHGGGAGWLRVWNRAGSLRCQVDDGGLRGSAEPKNAPNHIAVSSLPREPGHGLWVVQQLADRMQSLSSSRGTSVMIMFDYGY